MENPFKFGSVVDGKYFTDRREERSFLAQILNSPNHAVLISPRRFGKSSLVAETLKREKREIISLNMQAVTSSVKLAEALYRKYFALHPVEKARHHLSHLRIIPSISLNPLSGSPEVSFLPNVDSKVILEDVFTLLEKAGGKKRLIVVLDEFQEILTIEKGLDKILRSIMQEQKNINYILMGSQEDMMKKIFLRKKSPFYHFGSIIHLDRIPAGDFKQYIEERLPAKCRDKGVSEEIISFTTCHPYYTQQLAFQVWYEYQQGVDIGSLVTVAIEHIVRAHDFDYSRLWESMNKTNRTVLLKLAMGNASPMENPELPSSTIFSALKRLVTAGILLKNGKYVYDDPFFKLWVKQII
jgi:hypothetical protein